ncbi:MAG: Protein of unknown function (DUF3006), partial [Candidatus Frackibacter sp. T328-2]
MLIIDRFEGDIAVIEYNNTTFTIPKEALPVTAKEGDVIKIVVDNENTKERNEE